MDKHTPGPWSVVAFGQPPIFEIESEDANICQGVFMEEDARLIAAAPDLLAACRAVVGQLSPSPNFPVVIEPGVEPYAVKLAREAIARATGEAT